MTVPILQPAPLDIVPADAVSEIMERAQTELAMLEQQRVVAEAAAEEAERHTGAGGFDPAFNAWAVERLERLVATMRDDHEAEMQALLAGAQQRARACIDRAHVDADTILSYARALRSGDADAEPIAPVPPIAHRDPPRLVWRPEDAPATVTVPPVVMTEPPVVVTPPTVVAPAPEPVAVASVAPVPVVAVPVAVAPPPPPPPPPAPPVVEAFEDEPPEPAPVVAEPEPAPAPAATAAPESGLRGLLERMPTFAILQVLAVIVVLIIVLIKIG